MTEDPLETAEWERLKVDIRADPRLTQMVGGTDPISWPWWLAIPAAAVRRWLWRVVR